MKTNHIIQRNLAALALLATFSLQPSALLGQGSLTPPGAPAPTMKSADQIYGKIEVGMSRTPISSAPFTISQPGSYYLTTNLTVSSGNAITIAANGVTLDLNGFTISSTAASATGTGILLDGIPLNGAVFDITIVNGHIRSGVTNYSGGIGSGPGFAYGIHYSGNAPNNVVISKVSVTAVLNDGINVNSGNATVVEGCTVTMAGGYGILAYTIKSSVVAGGALTGGGYSGIYGSQVVDCQVTFSAGHGIYALVTAINSYGYSSTNGIGVYAVNAQNCYGYSSSYYGLSANIAQNCYGSSTSGVGLSANHLAISCFGSSQSGTTGLSAVNANFCFGSPSVSVSGNKYNMP